MIFNPRQEYTINSFCPHNLSARTGRKKTGEGGHHLTYNHYLEHLRYCTYNNCCLASSAGVCGRERQPLLGKIKN